MSKIVSIRIDKEKLETINKETEKSKKSRNQYMIDKILSDNQVFNDMSKNLINEIAVLGNIIENDYTKKEDAPFRHKVLKTLSSVHEIMNNILGDCKMML